MTIEKEKLLNDTLDKAMNIGFGLESEDNIEDVFAEKLMIIGTAVEEQYTTLDGFRKLIRMQKEQSQGMEVSFTRKEVYRDLPSNGNIAVIVEEIEISIKIKEDIVGFITRASAVLEFKNDRWKLIHWHVSKPDHVQSEVDTFGIEEWKQKTEELEKLVSERTADLIVRNSELETALTDLKSTQNQLIQSEKMASLGELTAGIAHEIQNPLNFVNNFSEVSNELIDEMKEELQNGNNEEAVAIANDIKQNLEKINHHGKRADAIVKGMLQHSRSSSGVKEPTDINALADEYLRLSYHGLRAKDKSFNADFKTDFGETIGRIEIMPQDIGRVLLNLYNNAFYAVNEKKTLRQAQGDTQYEPTVSIQTKTINNTVEIKISDNGNGIPQKVLDKIFQPFFTTKPTGQGTGLGLSLSYDIVKAHGGEIKIETKESEGSTFIIQLPTV